ncbi:MAG: phage tail protein [Cetobacterium sp.]
MVKTNLGKVVGDSAFEDWLKRNPGGAWEDFMEAIKGPGVLGFRYKETTSSGGLIYDVILDGDIVSGTIEVPKGSTGADFITLEFVRFDDEGNTIVRSKNSNGEYGDEVLIKRGPRGFTGGTGEGELPPNDYLYGEIRSFTGNTPPSGWLYTNGGVIEKKKYPHMSFLPGITLPQEPYFKLDSATSLKSIEPDISWEFDFNNSKGKLYQEFKRPASNTQIIFSDILRQAGSSPSSSTSYLRGMTNRYYYIESPEIISLSFVSMNKINATGNSAPVPGIISSSSKKDVDVYFDIEYLNENGDWTKGVELYNKIDFLPLVEESEKATAMIKSSFKSNKFRMIINNKSLANFTRDGYDVFFVGEITFGFDKDGNQYSDYLQLPNVKDDQGRYKVIYVGQPLEVIETSIYSYGADNIYNGEVPLSIAVKNSLPSYCEGITMSEPQELKLGYTNKYNKALNIWELIKTHENKEGYFYNAIEELKYLIKPTEYHIWSFDAKEWIEDIELKEKAKNELLDSYIELEMKKDKMIELKLDTKPIDESINIIKKQLEWFDGKI